MRELTDESVRIPAEQSSNEARRRANLDEFRRALANAEQLGRIDSALANYRRALAMPAGREQDRARMAALMELAEARGG